jgi:acetolactate synthase I/III small subunit
MEEKEFTITVFTENFVGLLNRITIIFTRRHINIESLTVSASEIKGIHRFTIVVSVTEEVVKKVVKQIQKNVDVIIANYYESEEIIYQEIALYKVPTKALAQGSNVEQIIRNTNARILTVEPEYIIIEKTGQKEETKELFKQLEPFGILQFVRSGRVAITKEIKELYNHLKDMEEQSAYSVINQN